VDQRREQGRTEGARFEPAEWVIADAARELGPPILTVDGERGLIAGIRHDAANAQLASAIEASGLSVRAAARALGADHRTLRRILAGETLIPPGHPLLLGMAALKG
jgi:hypothetical protein